MLLLWLMVLALLQQPTAIDASPPIPALVRPGGMAAALGHAAPNPVPSLTSLGYELLVDGKVVGSTGPTTTLVVDGRYEFTIRAAAAAQGVGHVDNSAKTILSGYYEVDGDRSVTLDVTVVQGNSVGASVYGYERFKFDVEAAAQVVVPAATKPVVAPAKAPVPAPIQKPVVAPVKRPVAAPVKWPVVAPAKRPVVAPAKVPVPSPVKKPVVAPVKFESCGPCSSVKGGASLIL